MFVFFVGVAWFWMGLFTSCAVLENATNDECGMNSYAVPAIFEIQTKHMTVCSLSPSPFLPNYKAYSYYLLRVMCYVFSHVYFPREALLTINICVEIDQTLQAIANCKSYTIGLTPP